MCRPTRPPNRGRLLRPGVLSEAPGGPVHWSPELVAILAYNCIGTTALGYFLWGKVLSMMPAATAGQVLMLTLAESAPPPEKIVQRARDRIAGTRIFACYK